MIQLEEIKLSYLPNRRSKLDITEEPWLEKGDVRTVVSKRGCINYTHT